MKTKSAASLVLIVTTFIGCAADVSSVDGYLVRGTATGVSTSTASASADSATGVVLTNNTSDAIRVAADGVFYFPNELRNGASYTVKVADLPASTLCVLQNGTGTIKDGDASDVTLTCTPTYSVAGTVTGLYAEGLIIEDSAARALTLTRDGVFLFDQLKTGDAYAITVSQNPDGETCEVVTADATAPTGVIASANVTGLRITCRSNE